MGGEHVCRWCGELEGTAHAEGCTRARHPGDLVLVGDVVHDPMPGSRLPPLGQVPFLPTHDHSEEVRCHELCAVAQWERYRRETDQRDGIRLAYVVTDSLPGPGAPVDGTLAHELRALAHSMERRRPEAADAIRRGADALERVSAQFVELEDADGRGMGASSGVDWEPYPGKPGLFRLGPFVLPRVPVREPSG